MADQQVTIPDRAPSSHLLFGQKRLIDRLFAYFVNRLPSSGQLQTSSGTLKQPQSKRALDILYLLSDSRGRQSEIICRVLDVVPFRDCHECGEIVDFTFGRRIPILPL